MDEDAWDLEGLMKTLVNGDYVTEYGRDSETNQYRLRQIVRGDLVLDILAETKEGALSASRILLLHELVRREDLRTLGSHEVCEGCVFEMGFQKPKDP